MPHLIFDPFDKKSCVLIAPNRKDRKRDTVANERKVNVRIRFAVLKTTAFLICTMKNDMCIALKHDPFC